MSPEIAPINIKHCGAVQPWSIIATPPPSPPGGDPGGAMSEAQEESPGAAASCEAPPKPRTRYRGPPSAPHLRRDSRCPQPTAMSKAIFRPRPYEEIYAEQAYLTTSLQVLSRKATDMIRRYSLIEDELRSVQGSKQRRRLRKQLNLARSHINEAAEQEKAIFLRLSELYMEGHSRDTWRQAHQQRPSAQGDSGKQPCSAQPRNRALLNAASPAFIPKSQHLVGQLASGSQAVPKISSTRHPESASQSAGSVLKNVDESTGDFACNHGLSYQYKATEKQDEEGGSQVPVPCLGRRHRLSLPTLQSLWPI